jgi:hypothetical protein
MVQLSLSTDTNIRSQLMTQIRGITNSNLFDISDKIKQILCERARDKIVLKKINFYSFNRTNFLNSSGKYEKKHLIILPMFIKKNVLMPIGRMIYKNN